jgi:hypothetical protein
MAWEKVLFVYFLVSRGALAVATFPQSDDPITELPPLQRPTTASHTVRVFNEAACTSWNEILTGNYEPPIGGSWSRVILDMMVSPLPLSAFLSQASRSRRMAPSTIVTEPFGLGDWKFFEQQLQSRLLMALFGLLRKTSRNTQTICRLPTSPLCRSQTILMGHTPGSLL